MRQSSRLFLGSVLALGATLAARDATAAKDVNPPPPNVLLLVDSSGSMEYKSSSQSFPVCVPTQDNVSERSRWIELLEVMTGDIKDYRCESIDRNGNGFNTEYSLNGADPPDRYYSNPYHRPMHKKCAPGPGTLPANVFDWANIRPREYDDINKNCNFDQEKDGLLDDGAFRKTVRFGLMTFDTLAKKNDGKGAYADGALGAWSYYLSAKQGAPAGCATLSDIEVGARNAAAPPWEGRLMNFGKPGDKPEQQNDRIQDVLISTRPFGATPIAGMLDDAREFLWNDGSADPLDANEKFGPKDDPYITGGCRKNVIILLSDGEPNMDLRPFCEPNCPYPKPEETAFTLANDPTRAVQTFVIGFAVSNVTLANATNVDCRNLSQFDLSNPAGLCSSFPGESQLQACCVLNRVAYNGGTNRAYFADDKDELRAALSQILSGVAAAASSRTLPVFASVPGGGSGAGPAGFRFYSSFKPVQFGLWNGVLERQRILCVPDVNTGAVDPTPQNLDKTKGDDFVWNVNSGKGPARKFWSVVGDNVNGNIYSERSMRPNIGSDVDGVGTYSGATVWGDKESWNTAIPPEAIGVDGTTCKTGNKPPTYLSATDCRSRHLRWLTGADTTSSFARCASPGSASCSLIGDIYHSTPRVVGRPDELLRDESYQIHTLKLAKRHTMLYTSTNDGFMHGFKVRSGDPANDTLKVDNDDNNELWAFMPPAVLAGVRSEFPPTHQTLLDGVPVLQDVIAVESPPASGKYKFERTKADAQAGNGQWRTILVQSFGGNRGGYFAVDITDPVVPANPNDPTKGPKFLWQLTEYSDGSPLFGRGGATPLITTIFYDDGNGAREVAVAILPGGEDPDPPAGGDVNRKEQNPANVDSRFPARTKITKYENDPENHAARALTVVRLDTGEIIRSFRADASKAGALDGKNRVLEVDIDSPITGIPVAFPGTTGAVSDRIFVGDRDGTLWRVDLASTNPDNWKMNLFFDAYSGQGATKGEPIATAPVLSVDQNGNVTVAFSTGDQDLLDATGGMKTYVYSLLERPNATSTAYESYANWFTEFKDGERVTGPMSLFNGALYFTSFEPTSGGGPVCGSGTSRVWGVDYILPKTPGNSTNDLDDGGKERLPDSGVLKQFIDNTAAVLANSGIIFGVGVTQLPSCTQEQVNTDTFFGSGNHTSITSVTPGKFQLVMHTSGAGNVNDGSQTKRIEIDLPTPPSTSRIDSWAALVE
jgi:type IV pilus assembly protein PilY1